MTSHKKTLLLILGMHRSGTSVVTRCCNLLGIPLGSEFIYTNQYNQRGFWEHSSVVSLHEALLAAMHYSWDDVRAMPITMQSHPAYQEAKERLKALLLEETKDTAMWAAKDPRMCRLLPLWQEVAEELDYSIKTVMVLRNPLESSMSLHKRDGMDKEQALLLWLRYNLDMELYSRPYERCWVYYPEFLNDWKAQAHRISEQISINWSVPSEEAATKIDSFLDRDLKHHSSQDDAFFANETILPIIQKAFHYTLDYCKDRVKDNKLDHEFDRLGEEMAWMSKGFDQAITIAGEGHATIYEAYQAFQSSHEAIMQSFQQIEKERDHYKALVHQANNHVAALHQSLSWRVTAPLRRIKTLLSSSGSGKLTKEST